jgi:hypothetical protein
MNALAKLEWDAPKYKIIEERGLSIERLHELFELDREKGQLRRRITINSRARAGDVAGTLGSNGRQQVRIAGRSYIISRLIYAIDRGEWPFGEVDHRDRNKSNDRPENLRETTRSENEFNKKPGKLNTSGVIGVSWHKAAQKWLAHIAIDGRPKHLGYFTDIDTATLAVDLARLIHHGDFAFFKRRERYLYRIRRIDPRNTRYR